jgi:acyl-CoA thioesterase-1
MSYAIIRSLVGIALVVCGASINTANGASNDSAPASDAATRIIVIDAQGDSTMWGFQTANHFSKSWQTSANPPALLQSALQARFGLNVIVRNNGVPGATIVDREKGINAYKETYAQSVAESPAHIVIVNFALNDADRHVAEPPEMFRAYMTQFIKESQAAGRIVVLEEPNPVSHAVSLPAVPLYVDVVDDLAKEFGLPLIRQYADIRDMPNWHALLIDGVHPTDALYGIKAERQREVIEPIVAKLLQE